MLTIYKASAGSGKTFTLAKKYITLLLGRREHEEANEEYELNLDKANPTRLIDDFRHRNILAITFTRKATEEMKTRILSELALLKIVPANPKDDSEYGRTLPAELHCSRGQLAAAASIALSQLIFDYQNFNVSTIDAFFQRVLHTFARELDRQSDYNVELDDLFVMRQAVGSMLDAFNHSYDLNSTLEKWLFRFMDEQMQQGKKTNFFNRSQGVFSEIVKFISNISKESFKSHSKDMEAYLNGDTLSELVKRVDAYKAKVLKDVKEKTEAVFEEHGYSTDTIPTTAKVAKQFQCFLNGEMCDYGDFSASQAASQMSEGISPKLPKNKQAQKPDLDILTEIYHYAYLQHTKLLDIFTIRESLTPLGLLQHAWKYLTLFYKENNTLLLSDTNELLQRIIGKDETPFIYERMGVQLKNYLIDEFQDTSRMQWTNLHPLVYNGVSEHNDSLVIGDEKQSIYRFRNSDSSILHSELTKAFPLPTEEKGKTAAENTNYRSAANIVRFNNTLFSVIAHSIPSIVGFENVVQGIAQHNLEKPGYVHIIPMDPDQKYANPLAEFDEAEEPEIGVKEATMHQLAQTILRQHYESGYKWSDIAILFNTNDEATAVVNFLLANYPEIKVLSDEALTLASSKAVQLIISSLKIIDQEQADPSKQEEEEKPTRKYLTRKEVLLAINKFEYFLQREQRKNPNAEPGSLEAKAIDMALDKENAAESLAHTIHSIIERQPSSLIGLVETIIGTLFTEEERAEQSIYLSAFQDEVIRFVEHNGSSLHNFLDYWAEKSNKFSVVSSAEADKVKVMTIHKSKGLQFKCVLIPFCNWYLYWKESKKHEIWVPFPEIDGLDKAFCPEILYVNMKKHMGNPLSPFYQVYTEERTKALIDCMNKTYVAFTRAENELVIWYEIKKPSKNKKKTDVDEKEEPTIINQILNEALQMGRTPDADPDLTLNLTNYLVENGEFELGQPTKAKKDKETVADKKLKPMAYPVTHHPALQKLLQLADTMELDKDIDDARCIESPVSDVTEEMARQRGVIMHDIMSGIRIASDLDRAVMLTARRFKLDKDQTAEYKGIATAFLSSPDARVAKWFGPNVKVHIEQPIFIPNLNRIRRPDRIIIYPNGDVDIIDYKFTEAHVDTTDQNSQVKEYMSLMRDMGHQHVRGYLCYPLLSIINEV